jgi:hypothetical protein
VRVRPGRLRFTPEPEFGDGDCTPDPADSSERQSAVGMMLQKEDTQLGVRHEGPNSPYSESSAPVL